MKLKGMIISSGEKNRAMIILVHGLGEHIGRYHEWANLFADRGIGFVGVDLPGHGYSPGRRGFIRSYNIISEIIDILVTTTSRTFPSVPIYLYGHSLGGTLALNYILKTNPKLNGAIISSPWLKLAFEPPKSKITLAKTFNYIFPWFIQRSGLNAGHISRETEIVDQYKSDPLGHGKISVRLFNIAMKSANYALKHSGDLKIRTLLLHGEADKITSPEASKKFAAGNNKTNFIGFEGGYHELHNEEFKLRVFETIIDWIDNKSTTI
jgi:alpha-beta hydrolase superfamily lysophospholipase